MNNLSLIGEIKNEFIIEFEGCQLDYETAPFNTATTHCFFATVPSEDVLNTRWVQISNFVAIKFQNKLDSEFERWNIYLFYRIENTVNRALHYSIENDTFSSRKILINTGQSKRDVINEHVLNKDMTIHSTETQNENSFIPNAIINESLKDIKARKRLGPEIENSLGEIIAKIKNISL
jgi:hypothetical protein